MSSVVSVRFTEKEGQPHPIDSLVDANRQGISSGVEPQPQQAPSACLRIKGAYPPPAKQLESIKLALHEHQDSFKNQPSASSFYFIVQSQWWDGWRRFAGGDGPAPRPIENGSIAARECAPPAARGDVTIAFASVSDEPSAAGAVALPKVAWKAISAWFGAEDAPLIYKGSFEKSVSGDDNKSQDIAYWLRIDRETSYCPEDVEQLAPVSAPAAGALPADSCFTCGTPSMSRCARCSNVHYCSAVCQKSHWKYHKLWCSKQQVKPLGRRGTTGLLNIGNSCYLNSTLQCLIHCHPLVKYFLSDRFVEDVNPTNKDGSGQNAQLVKEFERLSKDMWFDTKSCLSPARLKAVLGSISIDYRGNLQQDSHDVLELLLDRLHEDVNRVLVKPYIEQPEGDGTNDVEVGTDAWEKHRRRHNSVITELFGGQFKSNVSCCSENCSRVSVTFDYFNTLQLAIPGPMSHVMVVYVPYIEGIGGVTDIAKNRQLLRCVLEDLPQGTSATVLTVKQMLVETLQRHHIVRGEMEGGKKEKKTEPTLAVEDLFMVTWNPQSMAIEDVAGDGDDIRRITGEGILSLLAFHSDHKLPNNAVLLQKKNMSRHNILGNLVEQNKMELIGCPLYLSFDPSWSCARVRYLIWQQVSRFIHPELIKILNEVPAEVVKRNTLMSSLLRVFMSEANGAELTYNPTVSAKHKQHESCPVWVSSHRALSELWHAHHTEMAKARQAAASLRSVSREIPNAADISIGKFLNVDGIPYLCIRWDKLWSGLLVAGAFDIVSLEDSSHGSVVENTDEKKSVGDSVSLLKCFRLFTKQESLKGDNAWYCRVCKEHVTAKKELQLWSLPKVLVVGLKRFAIRGGGEFTNGTMLRSKIDDFVDFPVNGLDLSELCGSANAVDGLGRKEYVYDLFAVCNHYGRMGFGHYTSCVRNWNVDGSLSDKWFRCDDESVTPCTEDDVRSRAAYILFYLKRDP